MNIDIRAFFPLDEYNFFFTGSMPSDIECLPQCARKKCSSFFFLFRSNVSLQAQTREVRSSTGEFRTEVVTAREKLIKFIFLT